MGFFPLNGKMHLPLLFSLIAVLGYISLCGAQTWPDNQKIAVSLSYDDALDSQLDNALPALNKRGMKASFYIVPLSPAFKNRLPEWRALAEQGHELGNHSLFHACRHSKPGREWVEPFNTLEQRPVKAMVNEITVANTLLNAIDGQTRRTFTPPCFDQQVQDGNYVNAIQSQFVAIKGLEGREFASLLAPEGLSSQQIIDFIEQQPATIKLINILFHGIGGDHLVTDTEEHTKLLDYLQAHSGIYWVDTYRNIMLAKPE